MTNSMTTGLLIIDGWTNDTFTSINRIKLHNTELKRKKNNYSAANVCMKMYVLIQNRSELTVICMQDLLKRKGKNEIHL